MNARQAWAVLGVGLLTYEVMCADDELMTRGMYRCLDKHPIAPRVVVVLTALHLCRFLPERADGVGLLFTLGRLPRKLLKLD